MSINLNDLTTKKPEGSATGKYGDVKGTLRSLLTKNVRDGKAQTFSSIVSKLGDELPDLKESGQCYNRLHNMSKLDKDGAQIANAWFRERFGVVSHKTSGERIIVTVGDLAKLKG